MLESSLEYMIARTFPESLVVVFSGMILLNIKFDTKELLKRGMLLGIIISVIRTLPINFGVHTILSMIAVGVMFFKLSKGNLINSIISTVMLWIALALSEGIYILIATRILDLPMEDLVNNQDLKGALMTLPSLAIMLIIVIIFKKVKKIFDKIMQKGCV